MTLGVIGVGIVGAGDAGLRHARAISRDNRSRLVAVADPDQVAAERLAAMVRPVVAILSPNALETVPCDLWCICTPPTTHLALARRLLLGGGAVLIEKPVATTLRSAADFAAATPGADRTFVVSQHRFAPASIRLKEIAASGTYGACLGLSLRLYRHRAASAWTEGWKADPDRAGGGVLISLAYHILDLARWCFGAPSELAVRIDRPHEGRTETHVAAVGRLGGIPFVLDAGIGANATVPDAIVTEFERARVEWRGDTLAVDDRIAVPRSADELHARQLHALTRSILTGTPAGVTFADGLATLDLIDRLYRAGGVHMGGAVC